MRPLTKETLEMVRHGLLNSEWCGFSKRDTVNQLCDLALKGLAPAPEARAHDLLRRFRQWDQFEPLMAACADGPYWKARFDEVLTPMNVDRT
jgi:hypothetical protein